MWWRAAGLGDETVCHPQARFIFAATERAVGSNPSAAHGWVAANRILTMETYIALLRGINVGRAKRIAMADLRECVAGMGCSGVRTLLNSGNVVFQTDSKAPRRTPGMLATELHQEVQRRFGISSRVIVVTANDLSAVIRENPLTSMVDDPSRFLVAFVESPAVLKTLQTLNQTPWQPDRLAIGRRAAYLWCAGGILDSALFKAFSKAAGETVTTRNWATVLKLQAAISEAHET